MIKIFTAVVKLHKIGYNNFGYKLIFEFIYKFEFSYFNTKHYIFIMRNPIFLNLIFFLHPILFSENYFFKSP